MENSIDIFHLPSDVQKIIYGYLGVNEYLSLHRTCKETKTWLESFSLNNSSTRRTLDDKLKNVQYKIKESDEDDGRMDLQIQELLDSELKNITNIWIKNKTFKIYHDSSFQAFRESYCPRIRHLKLERFFDCVSEMEWTFFQALTNLESLEIEEVPIYLNKKSKSKFSRIPSCLKNLRSLRFLWRVKITIKNGRTPALDNSWIYNPLKYCPNLEMLKIPIVFTTKGDESKPLCNWTEDEVYEDPKQTFIQNIINSLKDKNWSCKLKYLDLRYFGSCNNNPFILSSLLQELVDLCGSKGVKLLNVQTDLCQGVNHGECILSVQHWVFNNREFIGANLPNLENLHVSTQMCWDVEDREPDLTLRKRWPKLKSLNLCLNSQVVVQSRSGTRMGVSGYEIVKMLVDSEPRLELKNFKLTFRKKANIFPRNYLFPPSLVRAHSITTNFPNLINLSLVGWDTDDMELAHLWEGLPYLETLRIDCCSTVSDLAFIGRNSKDPSFLKLESLKGLEIDFTHMSRVTDRFFKQVLCHVKVKQLVLRSSSAFPVDTVQCISSLSKGKVASNLDEITLDLKGLNELPEDEYIKLKKRFRSLR